MLRRIQISHFKCFAQEVSVEMSQFTVLYGKNGRGKSSVIQCLLLLSQSLRENGGVLDSLILNGEMALLGSWSDIVNRYSQRHSAIELIIETDEEKPLKLKYVESREKPTIAILDDIWVGEDHYFNDLSGGESLDMKEEPSPVSVSVRATMPQSGIKTYDLLRSLSYVSANRRGPVNFETRKDNIDPKNVDSRGERIINLLAISSDDFRQRFSQELSLILSGASMRVYSNPETPDRIELFMDSTDGNEIGFRPSNVGFGYSYVLPIVYKVLSAPDNGVVVIENPEAHLYPGAQSRLVDFLVKYAVLKHLQVILETHSDHIINGLRLAVKNAEVFSENASVLFFDRDEDECGNPEIKSIRIDSRGALSEQPRDFMDEWTRQMLELL